MNLRMKCARGMMPAAKLLHQAFVLLQQLGEHLAVSLVHLGQLLVFPAQVVAVLLILLGEHCEQLAVLLVLVGKLLVFLLEKFARVLAVLGPHRLEKSQVHFQVLPWPGSWMALLRRLSLAAVANDARHREGYRVGRMSPLLGCACHSDGGEPAGVAPRAMCRHIQPAGLLAGKPSLGKASRVLSPAAILRKRFSCFRARVFPLPAYGRTSMHVNLIMLANLRHACTKRKQKAGWKAESACVAVALFDLFDQ